MDVSREYIKMCEEAKEIQKSISSAGNWHSYGNSEAVVSSQGSFYTLQNGGWVWLPRQDQLQEMINGSWQSKLARLDIFCDPPTPEIIKAHEKIYQKVLARHKYINNFTSFEQLWLAFVMHERYEKYWSESEKEWIK